MKVTSAEAAKILKKFSEEYASLTVKENQSKEFLASVGEDVEECRPSYDFKEAQKEFASLEQKIRTMKHAISKFNLETEVPGFSMTIDEMLIYIPQLSKKKQKLSEMKSKLKRERVKDTYGSSNIIDYRYINYDISDVEREYDFVSDELSRAQTALDKVNSTEVFEIEL